MTHEEIEKKVLPIVAKYLCKKESTIDVNADLRDEYVADSLDIIQIVMDVEKEFSISVTDDATDGINTTKDIIDEVKRNILD